MIRHPVWTTAVVSGITVLLLWLALLPNGHGWPLLGVACVPLLCHIFSASVRQTVVTGILVGLGHFSVQLYWIVFVLGHYGGLPLYLSLPALLLLSLYMASYVVLFVLLARFFVGRFSAHLSLWLLPTTWVALDFLRSFVLTGFPWMDLGYGLAGVPFLCQSADLVGHYGLTYLIVLLNCCLALALHKRNEGRQVLRLAAPVVILFTLVALYSGWRWQQIKETLLRADSLVVAVVQGNVDQGQKWSPSRRGTTVSGYVSQSRKLFAESEGAPDLLVWPETALPFYPMQHPLLAPIKRLVREEGVMLLTGAPWYERGVPPSLKIRFFNSSLFFDTTGTIVARTSKSHLVPFGEYVPLKRFLPFIAPLVETVADFSPGVIRNPPSCQTARIGVLVCFESIFGEISRKWVDQGANLLVNMTNDAWYGVSSAPYQTLAMTRLRAVETRRSVVRSANTGFSGFIDPLGQVMQRSPLFVPWAALGEVKIMEERTPFVRGGYLFAPLCLVLTGLALVVAAARRTNRINK